MKLISDICSITSPSYALGSFRFIFLSGFRNFEKKISMRCNHSEMNSAQPDYFYDWEKKILEWTFHQYADQEFWQKRVTFAKCRGNIFAEHFEFSQNLKIKWIECPLSVLMLTAQGILPHFFVQMKSTEHKIIIGLLIILAHYCLVISAFIVRDQLN